MTFDDDFLHLETLGAPLRLPCRALGLDWPPPESIDVFGVPYVRESLSSITDEQRTAMTHVCRGAKYKLSCPEAMLSERLQ